MLERIFGVMASAWKALDRHTMELAGLSNTKRQSRPGTRAYLTTMPRASGLAVDGLAGNSRITMASCCCCCCSIGPLLG